MEWAGDGRSGQTPRPGFACVLGPRPCRTCASPGGPSFPRTRSHLKRGAARKRGRRELQRQPEHAVRQVERRGGCAQDGGRCAGRAVGAAEGRKGATGRLGQVHGAGAASRPAACHGRGGGAVAVMHGPTRRPCLTGDCDALDARHRAVPCRSSVQVQHFGHSLKRRPLFSVALQFIPISHPVTALHALHSGALQNNIRPGHCCAGVTRLGARRRRPCSLPECP